MRKSKTLVNDIIKTIILLTLIQAILYGSLALIFHFDSELIIWFFSILILYHFLLFLFLIAMQSNFYIEETKQQLERINLPNILTIIRLSSIPTVLFLFLSKTSEIVGIILIVILTAIFLTDLLDGIIARKLNQITRIGRYMDSISDYLIISSIAIIFFHSGLLHLWFFSLLTLRLFIQAGGMGIILLKYGSVNPETSFLGKASIFATMTLFILEIFHFFRIPYLGNDTFIQICEYITGAILSVSIIDKFIFLSKKLV